MGQNYLAHKNAIIYLCDSGAANDGCHDTIYMVNWYGFSVGHTPYYAR